MPLACRYGPAVGRPTQGARLGGFSPPIREAIRVLDSPCPSAQQIPPLLRYFPPLSPPAFERPNLPPATSALRPAPCTIALRPTQLQSSDSRRSAAVVSRAPSSRLLIPPGSRCWALPPSSRQWPLRSKPFRRPVVGKAPYSCSADLTDTRDPTSTTPTAPLFVLAISPHISVRQLRQLIVGLRPPK